ncbi:hypothetical protein ACFX2I_036470 [Malus domestica]|uniref:GDSL esterase/lipase At1g29660-like n=1 Tax=Malus domestica TaxID=3750 RepID=UPI00049930F9|nr:GDSL esterase/lipase At1g29660-like [Malus domestica]
MATNEAVRWFMMIGFLVVSISRSCAYGKPEVPCFFIFGDSLLDNGNNNFLPTLRVNYLPYGIDYPTGPTGRFCNGRTPVDVLAELLGFENHIPPFATTFGLATLRGLNYASGTSGIRAETGSQLGVNVNFDRQIQNHKSAVLRIASILRSKESAMKYLNECLYYVGMGNNDYLNNYLQPRFFNTSRIYTLEQYAAVLVRQYSSQIMTLYKYGARKFALVGVQDIANTTYAFNQNLVSLVEKLNADLGDARFIYVNSSSVTRSTSAGFKDYDTSCCPVNRLGLCAIFQIPCQNRSEHALWDSFHPTEAANIVSARRTYNSSDPSDTYPMDISHLVNLSLES